jgi:hypothetical protein
MVSLAKNPEPRSDTTTAGQKPAPTEALHTAIKDLSALVPVDARADAFKALKDSSKGWQSIKPDQIDTVLQAVEKGASALDTNRDGRLGSREIHAEVVAQVRDALANSQLNTGTLEQPKFSFGVDLMLHHLKHQQSFLVPVLKEQRIFNSLLGSYKEALKAFDTVFPNGFSRKDVVQALDGLDGSKSDGQISGHELQAAVNSHPKEVEATVKHIGKAFDRAAKGAEGICEYLLARPELMQQMAGVDGDIEQRLQAGKDIASSYREILRAHNADEVLAAASRMKEAAAVATSEE